MTVSDRPIPFPERTLRVLIVEDSPVDVELMCRTMELEGLRFEHRVVTEDQPFRAALVDFAPDVVLLDEHLPRFSGRAALEIIRERDATLPAIMVSGSLPEECMARLFCTGLTDYVLKDRLLRLGPAVRQSVQWAEVFRAEARQREALEAGERRFRAVAEASGDGLVVVDETGSIVFWNDAAERIFGLTRDQALGTEVIRLVPPRLVARHQAGLRGAVGAPKLPEPVTMEVVGRHADGRELPVELTVSGWEEGGRRFFSAQIRDITRRKEEARTRLVLSQAVEQTVSSVVITDVDGTIEYVNGAFERLTGYSRDEAVGQTPRILKSGVQPPDLYERLWADITAGRSFSREMTNRRKDGSHYIQLSTIFPIVGESGAVERFVGIGSDVTQERALEAQLRQAQKMEAIGQLAGGIAHDFNNILTGIMASAEVLSAGPGTRSPDEAEALDDLVAQARRGAGLVKRLMGLSRSDGATVSDVELRPSVDEVARTISRVVASNIEVVVEHAGPEGESPTCHLDEGELHQAILNLCINARDAMPGGGFLTIRTDIVDGRAVLEVTDTGTGIDAAVLHHVFEPFFTTKEVGEGTGLGLSMVQRFVDRAHGSIEMDSRIGHGTSVRLTLPLTGAAEPEVREDQRSAGPLATAAHHGGAFAPSGEAVAPSGEAAFRPGHVVPRSGQVGPRPGEAASRLQGGFPTAGSVLLAEDDPTLRRVARRVLEGMGLRVLSAVDGTEAVAILDREGAGIDLVLADLHMPGGGGSMLYRHTGSWAKPPRFLITSGLPSAEGEPEGALDSVPFLAKPWSLGQLRDAVSVLLAGSDVLVTPPVSSSGQA